MSKLKFPPLGAQVVDAPSSAEGDTPAAPQGGPPIMISYRELLEIRTYMARITAMLEAALALKGDVDALAARVGSLELAKASADGATSSRNTILTFTGGLVTAALGGGAIALIPWAKLWGG